MKPTYMIAVNAPN